ncbi:UDP-N-acetylglucosamine--N-acetylmuramyl-(pentapeptide) pyrophosphoryl-undecaprenol N-acetylglucosamine transferase [Acetobacter orientalis]|uniref:UDP-N-acetylglucosamine--N-acetylmuramyl-(Pentapeptide) pyrophosphoryl-undecaprenol N-acetylglucosamine transferase n=1 Tax=Acetobacter orientalis TaxID=146474 RepID=A0A2Z5ZJ19_9PROT|nr:UDP-N-acetylglucosamine--N-acetylmuramyl-(pentapeptide) pyrophosphoryl-undecaprenol N-acetylglucosamine transferase [Acetobacter orientalis]
MPGPPCPKSRHLAYQNPCVVAQTQLVFFFTFQRWSALPVQALPALAPNRHSLATTGRILRTSTTKTAITPPLNPSAQGELHVSGPQARRPRPGH